jgi:hypothetical protein
MNINVEETKTVIVLSQSISEGFDNERLSSVAGTRVGMPRSESFSGKQNSDLLSAQKTSSVVVVKLR